MKRPVIITLLIVALVLVCLGIGSVAYFAANGFFRSNNPFDTRNISSQLEESKTLAVDAEKPVTLKVVNEAGEVTVTGADVEEVQVEVIKTAYDSTQARADAEVKNIKYRIEQTENAITLRYEIPDSMNFRNWVNTVDFIVTVPFDTRVEVDGGSGAVSVVDTIGKVDIDNSFGNVTLENIEGSVSVQTNSGKVDATSIDAGRENIELNSEFGAITLRNADGNDITLGSNSGTITLREVRAAGDLSLRTDFGNAVYENGSANTLAVDSNSGTITLTKIRITRDIIVQADFGNIELEQATAASYDLHTKSGAVVVDGVKGKLMAHSDFGNIRVENAQDVTLDLSTNSGSVEFTGSLGKGPHTVRSEFGDIDMTLPADSKLDADLSTEFGSIKSDLPITVTLTESSGTDGDEISGSINGGGDLLTVQTNSGGVTIHASE